MWRDEPQRVRIPPSGHVMYFSEHLEILLHKINRDWVKNLCNQVNCRLGNKRSREAIEHKILLKLGPTMRFKMSVGDILAICDYLLVNPDQFANHEDGACHKYQQAVGDNGGKHPTRAGPTTINIENTQNMWETHMPPNTIGSRGDKGQVVRTAKILLQV